MDTRERFLTELNYRNDFLRTAFNDFWLAAYLRSLGGLASTW